MVSAITRNNVINKISIMLSVVGEWIKNRCPCRVSGVRQHCWYQQPGNRPPLGPGGAQYATEVWTKTKWVSYSSCLWMYNGASRRLVPPMSSRRFTRHEAEERQGNRLTWLTGRRERGATRIRLGSKANVCHPRGPTELLHQKKRSGRS